MNEAIGMVAKFMALSARTAPKTAGKDFVEIKIIEGEDIKKLAQDMLIYGEDTKKRNYDRDGRNVENSASIVLIAVKGSRTAGLNCGACGYSKCSELPAPKDMGEFEGPLCVWRIMDMGIAIGSAVKTAGILNVDNRIMYRIGVIAKQNGLIDGEIVLGIPLSATGKNIYFDR